MKRRNRQLHGYGEAEVIEGGTPSVSGFYWRPLDGETPEMARGFDYASHELVDGGQKCCHCDERIKVGDYVRRRPSGDWEHEACWRQQPKPE